MGQVLLYSKSSKRARVAQGRDLSCSAAAKHPRVIFKLRSEVARQLWYHLYYGADEGNRIELNLSHLAQEWKTTRQTLSKHLRRFEKWHLVKVEQSHNGPGQGMKVSISWKLRAKRFEVEKQKSLFLNPNLQKPPSCKPKTLKNKTLLKDTGGEGFPFKNRRPTTPGGRLELLKTVDDTVVLIRNARYYRYVMEQFRLLIWKRGGASRHENNIICGVIGRLIDNKCLGFARQLAAWLVENIDGVVKRLRVAIDKGLRAAYASVSYAIRLGLGILKSKCKVQLIPLGAQAKQCNQPSSRWDLNTVKGRSRFLALAREIVDQGGGKCPRCGDQIIPALLQVDSGLAFEQSGLCKCIYIALDRRARAAEERERREPVPPVPRGVRGVRGIETYKKDEREAVYSRRMAESGRSKTARDGPNRPVHIKEAVAAWLRGLRSPGKAGPISYWGKL